MSEIKLSNQKLTVVIGDVDYPEGWRELTVQTILADNVGAEAELARRKLNVNDRPVLSGVAVAYCALKRTGQIQAGTLADFEAGCLDMREFEAEPVDPTPSDLSPD
ncbi:MAG: hypothetical protein FWF90_16240 [Promicromonosporaceae bacterium]|nr:hypothetical protein [Promicromonosporaceae bacterium]